MKVHGRQGWNIQFLSRRKKTFEAYHVIYLAINFLAYFDGRQGVVLRLILRWTHQFSNPPHMYMYEDKERGQSSHPERRCVNNWCTIPSCFSGLNECTALNFSFLLLEKITLKIVLCFELCFLAMQAFTSLPTMTVELSADGNNRDDM